MDLDSGLEKMEAKNDKELEGDFDSDNDSVYDIVHWFFYSPFRTLIIFIFKIN